MSKQSKALAIDGARFQITVLNGDDEFKTEDLKVQETDVAGIAAFFENLDSGQNMGTGDIILIERTR
jgi:hypothetical protein